MSFSSWFSVFFFFTSLRENFFFYGIIILLLRSEHVYLFNSIFIFMFYHITQNTCMSIFWKVKYFLLCVMYTSQLQHTTNQWVSCLLLTFFNASVKQIYVSFKADNKNPLMLSRGNSNYVHTLSVHRFGLEFQFIINSTNQSYRHHKIMIDKVQMSAFKRDRHITHSNQRAV